MGGCISRLSGSHDTSQHDQYVQETEFAAHVRSLRPSQSRSIQRQSPGSSRPTDDGTTSSADEAPRIGEKLQLLSQTLQRARQAQLSSGLMEYGQQVASYLSANKQPDDQLLSLDIDNFHQLAASYNQRSSDLNLRHIDSPAQFLAALVHQSSDCAWRAVVRLKDGEMHHVSADVRMRAGAAPTIIVMEPANLYTFITFYFGLRQQSIQQLGTEPKWAFIDVGAQKSAADCVMFSMQFALAAYRHAQTFDQWHDNLYRHGTIADNSGDRSAYMPSPDAMLEYAQINLFHGERFLPALFYKHSHSSGAIEDVAAHQPRIKEIDLSTSRRAPKTEPLSERLEAFAVRRDSHRYSASIETSRATKIRTALDGMLPDSPT